MDTELTSQMKSEKDAGCVCSNCGQKVECDILNACIKLNPDNSIAVAQSIEDLYEALEQIVVLLANPLTTRQEKTKTLRLIRAMDEAWQLAKRALTKVEGGK